MTHGYPFAALVGQDAVKLALLLCAVEPRIGGVLLRGEKGTAKSTAVRGLAALLPGNARVHTVPLNATEDRVAGGLDLERTVAQGKPVFAPGLLAAAHEQVLYVDEVNLLDDHIADIVLDAAASGVNRVEREGMSVVHPAAFALIGTMNPEEGTLRPQVLDRFGLCVDVAGETDPERRVQLLQRREDYDADPEAFAGTWSGRTRALRDKLAAARGVVAHVVVEQPTFAMIAEIACTAHVAGHRTDVVLAHAARAHAAWSGRDTVVTEDVLAVVDLVLAHRRREMSQEPQRNQQNRDDTPEQEQQPPPPEHDEPEHDQPEQSEPDQPQGDPQPPPDGGTPPPPPEDDEQDTNAPPIPPITPAVGESFSVKNLAPPKDRLARRGSGKRQQSRSATRRGRYIRSRPARDASDLALDATLRAAAPHQLSRRQRVIDLRDTHSPVTQPGTSGQAGQQGPRGDTGSPARPPAAAQRGVLVERSDWQTKVRQHRTGTCIVFVVDASGSMGAKGRMTATKGAVLSLLVDAYQKRDRVSLIAFRRDRAETLLPPTPSVEVADTLLGELPVGGRTPLAAGLVQAGKVLEPLLRKEPNLRPLVVLISDGRGNVRLDGGKGNGVPDAQRVAAALGEDLRVQWIVVDSEATSGLQLGLASVLAESLQAPCYRIDDLKAQDLVGVVSGHL